MTKKIIILIASLGFSCFFACKNAVCKSENPIFNSVSPDQQAYKLALAEALNKSNPDELSFRMDAYWHLSMPNKATQDFIRLHVQGDDLCADMILEISDSQKGIEDVLKKQMMGYKGAMLEGLKYETKKDSSGITFVFKEVSHIND